jgi:hypothetical protein
VGRYTPKSQIYFLPFNLRICAQGALFRGDIDHQDLVVGSDIRVLAVRRDGDVGGEIWHCDCLPHYFVADGIHHHNL